MQMSSVDPTPEYSDVSTALDRLHADVDAPEGHGILCGMLSAGTQVNDEAWLSQVLPGAASRAESRELLRQLFERTVFQLGDPEFSFEPLLPRDDVSLAARTQALSNWCGGYLYGLGLGGVTETTSLSADAAEILTDLAKIAGVDYELDGADDAEEDAYTEVVEYVRVGTLLVFESLRGPRQSEAVH